jgi:hypothetical protein
MVVKLFFFLLLLLHLVLFEEDCLCHQHLYCFNPHMVRPQSPQQRQPVPGGGFLEKQKQRNIDNVVALTGKRR